MNPGTLPRSNLHRGIGRRIHHVRRDFIWNPRTHGIDVAISSFCHRFGIFDRQTRQAQKPEACRLLMYAHFMQGNPQRTVEAAVRSNKPMLLGQMMKRLQRMFATAEQREQVRVNARPHFHVTMDDALYRAASSLEQHYREYDGMVDDSKLVADVIRSGLRVQHLDSIAVAYQRRMDPIRDAVAKVESIARTMLVHAVGQERPIEDLLRRAV